MMSNQVSDCWDILWIGFNFDGLKIDWDILSCKYDY